MCVSNALILADIAVHLSQLHTPIFSLHPTSPFPLGSRTLLSMSSSSYFTTTGRSVPLAFPPKFRRKSLSVSDNDDDVLYHHAPTTSSTRDRLSYAYSSASSSPIAASAAFPSMPSSPTDYAHIRHQSSPRQDYYYAFSNSDHDVWSSAKPYRPSPSQSHLPRPRLPSAFSYSSPSDDSEGHPAPSDFDPDVLDDDMDLDLGAFSYFSIPRRIIYICMYFQRTKKTRISSRSNVVSLSPPRRNVTSLSSAHDNLRDPPSALSSTPLPPLSSTHETPFRHRLHPRVLLRLISI